jgi:hypothetical protein
MDTPSYTPSLQTRLGDSFSQWTAAFRAFARGLRVAMPGVIQSFNATQQTAIVQLALTDQVLQAGALVTITLPELVDVPVVLPRGGGFTLTMPLSLGDECLVVFGDMDIGAWWQSGGVGNNQIHLRRHSLADGFCIPGPWSQPRVLSNYSTSSAQLRSEDGTVVVDVAGSQITLTAPTVTVAGSSAVNITGGHCSIDGRTFLTHTHSGVSSGSGDSGPVV